MRLRNLGDVDMSKNFEKEYKEYLNSQAPDLWNRIEAGVDALGPELPATEERGAAEAEKAVSISAGKSKKAKKKRQIRYQHYRALVSAACLLALIIAVPVYLLTRPEGKDSAANDSVPQMVENVTIQNFVVDQSDSQAAAEESAPMEDAADGVTEVEIALEEPAEEVVEFAQVTEENNSGTATEEKATFAAGGGSGGQVASHGSSEETEGTDILSEAAGEEAVSTQQMQVTILGPGLIQEDGVLYSATVIGNAESTIVELLVPVGSDVVIEAEKTYTLNVQMSNNGAYYTVVGVTAME